jgi:hypothetical protein
MPDITPNALGIWVAPNERNPAETQLAQGGIMNLNYSFKALTAASVALATLSDWLQHHGRCRKGYQEGGESSRTAPTRAEQQQLVEPEVNKEIRMRYRTLALARPSSSSCYIWICNEGISRLPCAEP